ncbi:UDP-N-acetylmuramate--L-alanine ligase [Patescibacteria group bacterium]|nr:UDP-N-acetylmuramate--L-alanine ligase [Patescibacteria group bacterium]
MSLLNFNNFYLVGIKGVAMTSMAQLLIDANKKVSGSDLKEEFVTQEILNKLKIDIDTDFNTLLPEKTECVIYTAAHQAKHNPQVKKAIDKNIPVISQAEAVAELFNSKQGIAVCGVGGKSTVSAMIAWILEKLGHQPSFSIGVGNIPGLNKTGQWNNQSKYFVIEADEYVINPERGINATARFSFLKPNLTICTNLKFDHPDVYRDFKHTQQVFNNFFTQTTGKLIINYQDLNKLIDQTIPILSFGEDSKADICLKNYQSQRGETTTKLKYLNQNYQLKLKIPGKYNVMNALAAILAVTQIKIDPQQAIDALYTFHSTKRRFEYVGEKNGVKYYDDYAHHPHEVKAVITALNDWYPHQRKIIAFQSHTYSRTKKLFNDFINAFQKADEVLMIDIFSSARESVDLLVTSTKLCKAIETKYKIPSHNLKTIKNLAKYCKDKLEAGDVIITIGAGDIYQVHELI